MLGTTIRYITGNLDQNDLQEINKNLNLLFQNQEKITKQVDKYNSFANHITDRYLDDLQIIQQNINTSLKTLDEFNQQLLVQHNILLSQKLLYTLRSIQRTITLAFNEITNLEIISATELDEIIKHLKLIYKKEELLELSSLHLFKLLEFSKFRIISSENLITCILYIPILNPTPYTYHKIYPTPNNDGKTLIPPAKYLLYGAKDELWTDEKCLKIENTILCLEKPIRNKCLLNTNVNCTYALAINNYKLIQQLYSNKILISCKNPLDVVEECSNNINRKLVVRNVLISSEANCKLIIDDVTFENACNNFTYNVPIISSNNFETKKHVILEQKHLHDFVQLREEVRSLNNIELHPLEHVTHISILIIILILLFLLSTILYAFRKKIMRNLGRPKPIENEEPGIQLQEKEKLYPLLPSAPNGEDALS